MDVDESLDWGEDEAAAASARKRSMLDGTASPSRTEPDDDQISLGDEDDDTSGLNQYLAPKAANSEEMAGEKDISDYEGQRKGATDIPNSKDVERKSLSATSSANGLASLRLDEGRKAPSTPSSPSKGRDGEKATGLPKAPAGLPARPSFEPTSAAYRETRDNPVLASSMADKERGKPRSGERDHSSTANHTRDGTRSGRSVSPSASSLPSGWVIRNSTKDGSRYFFNTVANEATWDAPPGFSESATPSAPTPGKGSKTTPTKDSGRSTGARDSQHRDSRRAASPIRDKSRERPPRRDGRRRGRDTSVSSGKRDRGDRRLADDRDSRLADDRRPQRDPSPALERQPSRNLPDKAQLPPRPAPPSDDRRLRTDSARTTSPPRPMRNRSPLTSRDRAPAVDTYIPPRERSPARRERGRPDERRRDLRDEDVRGSRADERDIPPLRDLSTGGTRNRSPPPRRHRSQSPPSRRKPPSRSPPRSPPRHRARSGDRDNGDYRHARAPPPRSPQRIDQRSKAPSPSTHADNRQNSPSQRSRPLSDRRPPARRQHEADINDDRADDREANVKRRRLDDGTHERPTTRRSLSSPLSQVKPLPQSQPSRGPEDEANRRRRAPLPPQGAIFSQEIKKVRYNTARPSDVRQDGRQHANPPSGPRQQEARPASERDATRKSTSPTSLNRPLHPRQTDSMDVDTPASRQHPPPSRIHEVPREPRADQRGNGGPPSGPRVPDRYSDGRPRSPTDTFSGRGVRDGYEPRQPTERGHPTPSGPRLPSHIDTGGHSQVNIQPSSVQLQVSTQSADEAPRKILMGPPPPPPPSAAPPQMSPTMPSPYSAQPNFPTSPSFTGNSLPSTVPPRGLNNEPHPAPLPRQGNANDTPLVPTRTWGSHPRSNQAEANERHAPMTSPQGLQRPELHPGPYGYQGGLPHFNQSGQHVAPSMMNNSQMPTHYPNQNQVPNMYTRIEPPYQASPATFNNVAIVPHPSFTPNFASPEAISNPPPPVMLSGNEDQRVPSLAQRINGPSPPPAASSASAVHPSRMRHISGLGTPNSFPNQNTSFEQQHRGRGGGGFRDRGGRGGPAFDNGWHARGGGRGQMVNRRQFRDDAGVDQSGGAADNDRPPLLARLSTGPVPASGEDLNDPAGPSNQTRSLAERLQAEKMDLGQKSVSHPDMNSQPDTSGELGNIKRDFNPNTRNQSAPSGYEGQQDGFGMGRGSRNGRGGGGRGRGRGSVRGSGGYR